MQLVRGHFKQEMLDVELQSPRQQYPSSSHQALGRDSEVEAVSESDGIIEAIRMRGNCYVTGFQWHPELHAASDLLDSGPILDDFLAAAERQRE